ncbi:MAG TPA: hypothetical protein VJB99_00175 [Patescibacteria group bacterium]|nr:hypothetical protein [Patescibacteria group bacterium]
MSKNRMALDDLSSFCEPNKDGFVIADVDGLRLYPDRSQLLPYRAVYLMSGDESVNLSGHQDYLHSMGIGARELRFVRGMDLFDGILGTAAERSRFVSEMGDPSVTVDTFTGASPGWQSMVKELSLPSERIRTPRWDVAIQLDDKELLRRIGSEIGVDNCFPVHTFAHGASETMSQIEAMRAQYPSVVVKRPDLESGEGTYRVNGSDSLRGLSAFLDRYARGSRPLIVEQWVDGRETVVGSLQWYLPPLRSPQRRFVSRQYCIGMVHDGNVIGSQDGDVFPEFWPITLRQQIVERGWSMTGPFVEKVQREGYVGPLGFDFIVVREGEQSFRIYLLECNARRTASTYLESVRWQVQRSGRLPTACAAMRNCHPASATHWQEVVQILKTVGSSDGLGDIAMKADTGVGVLIALPRCLELPHPKCLLISVASKVKEAEMLLDAAKARLESQQGS